MRGHEGLRKARKALLADLSALVKTARRLQSIAMGIQLVEDVENTINEVTLKAFKIVTRGVRFLDIWESSFNLSQTSDAASLARHDITDVPPTPPADSTTFGQAISMDEHATLQSSSDVTGHTMPAMRTDAVRPSDAAAYDPRQQTTRDFANASSFPLPLSRPGTSQSIRVSRPPSTQIKRQSASHRVSHNGPSASSNNLTLASQKLGASHDAFLSHQGSFIGRLHLQSRTLSELLQTTQQSVTACRDLLAVVEAVSDRDAQRSDSLYHAKDVMYSRITDLVQATRDIFRTSKSQEENEGVIMPEDDKKLMNAATGCVKAAGEVVAQTRFVLEKIGDFEFEPIGLGIFEPVEKAKEDAGAEDENQAQDHTRPSTPTDLASRFPPPPVRSSPPKAKPESANTASSSPPQPRRPTVVGEHSVMPLAPLTKPSVLSVKTDLKPIKSIQSPRCDSSSTHGTTSWGTGFDQASTVVNGTILNSVRASEASAMSQPSTRATTPDYASSMTRIHSLERIHSREHQRDLTESQTTLLEDCDDTEARVLEKTFAHELMYNKEGQVTGGTLPALVERLTTHDSTPDSTFVSTFYLTFRLFTTPVGFAEALVDRFNYVESPHIAGPVRLRVYNVFKGWLESHWRNDCDHEALDVILEFAAGQLKLVLPAAGKRLTELGEKVSDVSGAIVPRLVSSIGKTNTSIAQYVSPDTPLPPPIISKSQLTALRNWKHGGGDPSILDFDPLELARQFTLKESKIFCSIMPEELLAMEWTKKAGSRAVNVRAMSTLSTDLATLVADTILHLEDPKKRAAVIKQWVKIAKKSLELNNYDSLMAIICSLNSSTILRLKRTWELVSTKTKDRLESLRSVVDVSKNYAVLRQRLQNHVPPCLPFVGTYLTDLTFVDVGNQATRQLHGEEGNDEKAVINFDKHMKTAKIIGELQRFQIPYRLTGVPELQDWMSAQIMRVQSSDQANIQNYYRRSLLLEPREPASQKPSPTEPTYSSLSTPASKGNFDFLSWTHSKDKAFTTSA